MNSLRFRLIAGFALVAIVPLVVVVVFLSRKIQDTVRTEAAERLGTSLRYVEAQFRADGQGIAQKLELLARDPQLRRLYLVESASRAELRDYLATQQFVMGLDYLWIVDTGGRVVADGMEAPWSRFHSNRYLLGSMDGADGTGLRIASVRGPLIPDSLWLALDVNQPVLYGSDRVGMLRGGKLLDLPLLLGLGRPGGIRLVLYDSRGRPAGANFGGFRDVAPPPAERAERFRFSGEPYLARGLPLTIGPAPHARVAGLVSTSAADETISALHWTAGLIALLGLAIAVVLGTLWSRQISRPVERLAAFSDRISRGEWDEPLRMESLRELQTLVAALERMRGDLGAYRDRLTAGERQAAYGQMARKVAHEIKNPLTPIAISVADLKRSYDLQRPDFPQILDQAVRTIGEEVQTLKNLIQEFSDFGRFPEPRFERFDTGELLADLGTLHGREVADGRLHLEPPATATMLTADRAQLRQALLNLIQNGLDATASGGRVDVWMRGDGGALEIAVADTGPGLSAEQRAQLFVPGFTTKPKGSGLGLTIVERIVSDHRGTIAVESAPGSGTTFRIRLPLNLGA